MHSYIRRAIYWLLAVVTILTASFFFTRMILFRKFERSGIENKRYGADDNIAGGIKFKSVTIQLRDRILQGRWLAASDESPALFILHGDGENIGDWVMAQTFLQRSGYSSFVFDYSGFGNSTGKPSVKALDDDAVEAYKVFIRLAKGSKKRILFAHSLGCCLYLDHPNSFAPDADRIVMHAPISSARDYLIQIGALHPAIKLLLPDIWDNAENLRKIQKTLYFVQGKNDLIVQQPMRDKISESAGKSCRFLLINDQGHNTIYQYPSDEVWQPIMQFIR